MPKKRKNHLHQSPIYFFAIEFKKTHGLDDEQSIDELIKFLLPRWHSMTSLERKVYQDLAKQSRRNESLKNEHAITPIIPSMEELRFIDQNFQETQFLNGYFSMDLDEIFRRRFIFVNFQIFFQADDEDGGNYYPAEMAILKYSFASGINKEYSTMIKPEKFPVGYMSEAFDRSRRTHQIPPLDCATANGNYEEICRELQTILTSHSNMFETVSQLDSDDSEQPILVFCHAFERNQTSSLLNWLVNKSKRFDPNRFRASFNVCSFEALTVALLHRLDLGRFSHQSVREQLHRPIYTLQVRQRCLYHDSLAIQYCSRAIVHGFRLFLEDFIRQRFLEQISEKKCQQSANFSHQSNDGMLNFSLRQNFIPFQSCAKPSMEIDCRWSTSTNNDERIVTIGRGGRKVIQPPDKFTNSSSIGHGTTRSFHF